jgi:hypothetical protein
MPVKFARLDYITNKGDIPVYFNVIKQGTGGGLDWYIDRYNPLNVTDVTIAGEAGYSVLLPITYEESLSDKGKVCSLISRAVESLRGSGVEIFMPPPGIEPPPKKGVALANGVRLFPFFLEQAIGKWVTNTRRDPRFLELAIINGQTEITENIMDNVRGCVNFASVIDLANGSGRLGEVTDDIYNDTGLNIVISGMVKTKGSAVLRSADIVVTTAAVDYDSSYKRGALVIDLTGKPANAARTALRRPDLMVVDGLLLKYNGAAIPLNVFELALYLKNRGYRYIAAGGYSAANGEEIRMALDRMDVGIYVYTLGGKMIKNAKVRMKFGL